MKFSSNDITNQFIGIIIASVYGGRIVERDVYFLSTWLSQYPELYKDQRVAELRSQIIEAVKFAYLERQELVPIYKSLCELLCYYGVEIPKLNYKEKKPDTDKKKPPTHILIPRTHEMFDKVGSINFSAHFCFTGVFAFGERTDCERVIEELGGIIKKQPVKTGRCYLVVGTLSNPRWLFETAGRKIEDALMNKQCGSDTWIIHEDDWVEAVVAAQGATRL